MSVWEQIMRENAALRRRDAARERMNTKHLALIFGMVAVQEYGPYRDDDERTVAARDIWKTRGCKEETDTLLAIDLTDGKLSVQIMTPFDLQWLRNFYRCPECHDEWEDEWDCACDEECPGCGLDDISPYKSEDV